MNPDTEPTSRMNGNLYLDNQSLGAVECTIIINGVERKGVVTQNTNGDFIFRCDFIQEVVELEAPPPDAKFYGLAYFEAWENKRLRLEHAGEMRAYFENPFKVNTDTRFNRLSPAMMLRTGRRTRESRNQRGVRQLSLSGVH